VVMPARGLVREALAAAAASTLLLNNGAAIGWSSPAIPSMKTDQRWGDTFQENPFSESMTGAIIILTSALGNVATPYLVSKLGPKLTLLAVDLPLHLLGWAGVVAAGPLLSLPLLLLARGLTGVGVGLSVSIVPNYVIDISSPDNQGLLGLMPQLMISLGLLGVYVVGALVDWWWTSLGCLLLQVPSLQEAAPPPPQPLLLVCLLIMPDSPASLVARGEVDQARSGLPSLGCTRTLRKESAISRAEVEVGRARAWWPPWPSSRDLPTIGPSWPVCCSSSLYSCPGSRPSSSSVSAFLSGQMHPPPLTSVPSSWPPSPWSPWWPLSCLPPPSPAGG